jgi:hypothetical protein
MTVFKVAKLTEVTGLKTVFDVTLCGQQIHILAFMTSKNMISLKDSYIYLNFGQSITTILFVYDRLTA